MSIPHEVRTKLFNCVENKKGELIDFLKQLVNTPSVVGQERAAQEIVSRKFQEMDLELDVFVPKVEELRDHPAFFETTSYQAVGYDDRPNVVGILKGQGRGRSLILQAHIDVVSVEPVEKWTYNPWEATIVGNKLFGRGSADCKGGLAAITYALLAVQDAGITPKGNVILESVIEEEDGGVGGALATILRGHTADAVVIAEPHWGNDIVIGSGGVLYFRVKVPGHTAHAVYAHRGVNALGKAMKIYDALMALNEYRQNKIRQPLFEKGPDMVGRATTINIGSCTAGDWPSTVPGEAELGCRIAWAPTGETVDSVKRQVEETIERACQLDPWLRENPATVEWFGWKAQAHVQDMEHPIVQTVKRIYEDYSGELADFRGTPAGTDARFYVLNGGMPTLCFGPQGDFYHGFDEYVNLDTVIGATKVFAETILEWCGSEYP